MRVLPSLAFAAGLAVTGAAAASGGVYASSPSRDAAACARLCADDGLCMAWSYQADGACELRATVPQAQSGVAFGLSRRAPALRTSVPDAPALEEPAAPIAEPTPEPATPLVTAASEDDLSGQLLGGLEEDATALRY